MATHEDRLVARDAEAMRTHAALDGTGNLVTLAAMTWGLLRGLGVRGGQMLTVGADAAAFAGLSETRGFLNMGFRALSMPIPPDPGAWPHDDLTPVTLVPGMPQLHDVVLANLPYADLYLSSVQASWTRNRIQQALIQNVVDHLLPGGLAVVVANHRYLDAPGQARREMIRQEADLLGMVRLAGATLHPDLPTDVTSPVDLLVLRKRLPGEPDRSREFVRVERTHYGPVNGGINVFRTRYLLEHDTDQVGEDRLVPDLRTGQRLQIVADSVWEERLAEVLVDLANTACADGLTIAARQGRSLFGPGADVVARHRFFEAGELRELFHLDDPAAVPPTRSTAFRSLPGFLPLGPLQANHQGPEARHSPRGPHTPGL